MPLAEQTAEMLLASFNCIKPERSECRDGLGGVEGVGGGTLAGDHSRESFTLNIVS